MRMCTISLVVLLTLTTACSGGSSLMSSSVSGAYEFIVTSNVTGGVTLVEADLASSGNQISATGPTQVQILTFEKKNWYVNGVCAGSTPGQNSVAASLSGSDVALTFNEGGSALSGQGVLTGSEITGNYSVSNSNCPDLVGISYPPGTDSGGFVGNQVPNLAGTFAGTLNLPDGTDNVALTLTEGSNSALAVSAEVTGATDNGTFPLTGSAVGNVMFVSGTINGQSLSLFGYYDRAGSYTGMPNSFLVFDYNTQVKLGLLLEQ